MKPFLLRLAATLILPIVLLFVICERIWREVRHIPKFLWGGRSRELALLRQNHA